MIVWSLIKKLYKLTIIFGVCSIVYFMYLYIENPKETKEKIKQSGEYIEEKAKDLYNRSTIEKNIKTGTSLRSRVSSRFSDRWSAMLIARESPSPPCRAQA